MTRFNPLPSGQPVEEPFSPCFIVGCERSGTTLLAVLLDRHHSLAVSPETHFLLRMPRTSKPIASKGDSGHEQLVERFFSFPRSEDLGLDRVKLLARFKMQPAAPSVLFQCILQEYAALHGKPRAGEKTPLHLWYVPTLVEWYPECRIIGIVRDGRDVVCSMLSVPWNVERRLRPHCLTWIHGVRAVERYAARYPKQFRVVRYMDLVVSPEETLRGVDEFLGLEYEATHLAPGNRSDVVPEWENDWKGKALEPLDPSRAGGWKKRVTDYQRLVMNTMMRRELVRLGYDDTEIPRTSPIRLARELFLNALCKARLYRVWDRIFGRPGK